MKQTSSERPSLLFACYKYHQPIEGSFIEKEGWELRSRSEIEPKKGNKFPGNSPNVTVKKQCAFFLNITPKRRLRLEKSLHVILKQAVELKIAITQPVIKKKAENPQISFFWLFKQ